MGKIKELLAVILLCSALTTMCSGGDKKPKTNTYSCVTVASSMTSSYWHPDRGKTTRRERTASRESAGMRRWRRGRSGTFPVRGCASEQINQQSDGSAKSCVTEISLVVFFRLRLCRAPC